MEDFHIWLADIVKIKFPMHTYFNTAKDFYYSVLSIFKIAVYCPKRIIKLI